MLQHVEDEALLDRPVFYAAAPRSYFTKLEYAASGLAPAVLLTVLLAVALALVAKNDVLASVVAWALLLNVMGSAGDMLMMRKLVPWGGNIPSSP